MKRICLLICCGILGGCFHSPQAQLKKDAPAAARADVEKPQLSPSLVERTIVKGKTTKKELIAALGAPSSVEKNSRQLTAEQLAKAKGPLPPVARTREFWRYWSLMPGSAGNEGSDVLNLLVFLDDNDVAVDYLTAVTHISK